MQAFSSVAIFCGRQRFGHFDDWPAHLKATLDLENFEEARKIRVMRSKLYGAAAEESENFKLDNPIRAQDYSAVKERLLRRPSTRFATPHETQTFQLLLGVDQQGRTCRNGYRGEPDKHTHPFGVQLAECSLQQKRVSGCIRSPQETEQQNRLNRYRTDIQISTEPR
ncbi:hypothetical protein OUZ56_024228 [Daphnia magna]|uniref:Uncharacterized protein n=1 Tax=Daphnia magna TaxID=35525 RepID=A0ABR0B0E1_9CRUS|nr:hypothetical protein OUZ56_024228 [Daphnia magna]